MTPRPALAAILILALLPTAHSAQPDDGIRITVQPPVVVRKTFDPRRPPPDMPPLTGGEAAVTAGAFGIDAQFRASYTSDPLRRGSAQVRIEGVQITTTLEVTLWLPAGAAAYLVEHEETHRLINEHFYKDAEAIARQVAQKYVGTTLAVEGPDADDAAKKALQKAADDLGNAYLQRTQTPAGRVNAIFDRLTDHGRKRQIDARGAMKAAMDEYERERRDAGERPR